MKKNTSVHPLKSRIASKDDFLQVVNENFVNFDSHWYYLTIGDKPKRAVTIKHPYSHLVCINMLDSVEMPHDTKYRGYVWIHSAKKSGVIDEKLNRQIKKDIVMRTMVELRGCTKGAIVGCAELIACIPLKSGKYKYVFRNAIYFKHPSEKVSGKSMLWGYDGEAPQGECLLRRNQPIFNRIQSKYDEVQRLKAEEKKTNSFAEKVRKDTKLMLERLTNDEIFQVSFLPLMLTEFAVYYAEMARKTAAQLRLEYTKKVSRDLVSWLEVNKKQKKKHLDSKHESDMMEHFQLCMDETEQDRTVLYYTVSNELKKVASEIPHEDVRIFAIISSLFIELHREYNKEIDKLTSERIPEAEFKESILPLDLVMIDEIMHKFAGVDEIFDYKAVILQTGMKVIFNKVRKLKFDITELRKTDKANI